MTKKFYVISAVFLSSLAFGCQSAQEETKSEPKAALSPTPVSAATVSPKAAQNSIDVAKLVGKPAAELDKALGAPEKITPAAVAKEMPGEYRLYKLNGHPKGLSVRFYKDKAVRFNLLLGTPEKSAREALQKYFGIDVSKMKPVKGDPLSETWNGSSNGVNFATAYAKREKAGGDFVMVHAEIAQ